MKIGKWNINLMYVASAVILIILVSIVFIFKNVMSYKDISKVSYLNRTYLYHNEQIDKIKSSQELLKEFQQTKPTEVTTKGMEVYDIDKNSQYVSTVIFLKTKDNKFLIYSLSGEP